MLSYSIIEDIYHTNRVFCSSDYDRCVDYLCDVLPFEVHRFTPSEPPLNGWEIPPKWDVEEASIAREGEVIYDGTHHPLAVIALSAPFEGTVSRETLRDHLHTVEAGYQHPDAIPFHFRQQYRPWDRDWGFCVPHSLYEQLEPGAYDVVIRTLESGGYLDVLEYTHQGAVDETFVFVAHLDHPGMANDDLAGCAVGVELFDRLRDRETKFSYRLVILQEIIASEYYLHAMGDSEREKVLGSLFLEMLGSDTPLALQRSVQADSIVERCLEEATEQLGIPYRTGDFRSIIGNDEIVWEAHGISMPSLSRFPYPEYHTSDDNPSIISREHLAETVDLLDELIRQIEQQKITKKKFRGVPCTSNPEYDLYIDTFYEQYISSNGVSDKEKIELRAMMDYLPMMDTYHTVTSLLDRFNIGRERALNYLRRWEEKELIEIL